MTQAQTQTQTSRPVGRPKRGQKTLDREAIGRATLEVLTEEGAGALSFARLGKRLGVRSQTLYYHVASVSDMVNAARGILLSGVEARCRPGEAWAAFVERFAQEYYTAFLPLAQANSVFFAYEITDPTTLEAYDAFLECSLDAGVEGASAMKLLLDLEHSIFSLIFEQTSWHSLFSPEAIERERVPTLAALLRERDTGPEVMRERLAATVRVLTAAALDV